MNPKPTKFPLGKLLITRGAAEALPDKFIYECIARHWCGDWGDLCDEDKELNERSLDGSGRLLSRYLHGKHVCYVITEYDRSVTTCLLNHEY